MDSQKVKVKRYEIKKCENCKSLKLIWVGWRDCEGYYCESCNLYSGKNGKKQFVDRISYPNKDAKKFLFESDLRFKR